MPDRLITLLSRGPASAQELATRLGISQPTFSRLARTLPEVVPFGEGRARRYALAREVRGLGQSFPVHRISESGQVTFWATLRTLHGGAWFDSTDGEDRGLVADLPYFIQDMRPQGFIGRAFPAQHADLGLPAHISRWSSDDVLVALARRGEDCVGNLIVGEESLARYLATRAGPARTIASHERAIHYRSSPRRPAPASCPALRPAASIRNSPPPYGRQAASGMCW